MKPRKQKEASRPPFLSGFIYSIKTQLAFAMLAATLIPLALATALGSRAIGQEARISGLQALESAARQTAQYLDAFVEMGLYHGTASASLPEVHRYFLNPSAADLEALKKTLGSIQEQNPVFIRHVTLFDAQGTPITSSSPEGTSREHPLLPESLAAAMETGFSTLSPVHFGEGQAHLCFYSPVIQNGKPVGLLRISYSAAILQQLVTRYTGLLGTESFPVLLNEDELQIANGILPYGDLENLYILGCVPPCEEHIKTLLELRRAPPGVRHQLPNDQLKESAPWQAETPQHHRMVSAAASLKTMPWRVLFFEPEEVLLQPVRLQQKNTLILSGVLAVLTILSALWLANTLTSPIKQLSATARRAAQEMRPLPLNIHSRNETGRLAEAFNRLFEVLDLKQQELIQSEERLRITLDSIGDCVISTDTAGRITGMNPAAETLIESTLHDTQGKLLSDVLPLRDAQTKERLNDISTEVLTAGITLHIPSQVVFVTRSGKEKRVADSAAPIRNSASQIIGCVLVLRDVTEKHHLESRLVQSQKMDALGQMAGGVAHDFNNMLTPILGAAQLLEQDSLSEVDRKRFAGMISAAARRAAELTHLMLTFSRKAPTDVKPIDMRKVIEDSRTLLQHSIGSHISIRTHCPLTPLLITGDIAQIQNILFNLALNARDAMPERGTLTFHLRRILLDQEYCRLHSFEINPGPYIEVQVADSGHGIAPEILPRIFDPFFTTKPSGKGTGLGLASVYGIMKKHNGLVTVYSEKGHGTIFHLYFPETTAASQTGALQTAEGSHPHAPPGTPAVLIIDDEEGVRTVEKAALESLGYDVLSAGSGPEGIEVYRLRHDQISLIMLDLVMPGMSGEETFAQLQKINSQVKTLVVSGFDAAESISRLLRAGASGFLQKPFQISHLAKALQRVLFTTPPRNSE